MAVKITLYSTGCPKCKVLEAKLNNKHIYSKLENYVLNNYNTGIISQNVQNFFRDIKIVSAPIS